MPCVSFYFLHELTVDPHMSTPRMGINGEETSAGNAPAEAKGGKKKINFPVLQHNQDVMSASASNRKS